MAVAESIQQRVHGSATRQARPQAKPAEKPAIRSSANSLLLVGAGLTVLASLASTIATGKYYTPRSNVGFYLGVAGSVMMLAMLLYPLRKHARFMQSWGSLKHWFRWHMVMGIVGPTLVLFHSTFHIRSTNAGVALFSMLSVVASGIIGRFIYTKIHYGLYGSRATLDKLQAEFSGKSADARSLLHFAPRVEAWLQSFERESTQPDRSFGAHLYCLLTLGLRRNLMAFRCARELRRTLRDNPHSDFRGGAPEAIRLATSYLKECQRVAQFSTYERCFSLWHVLHIPFIYILAASAIFHIVAVYMY